LWEEVGLHFPRNGKVVRGLALGFQPCSLGSSFRLNDPRHFVELKE
jgi:hypothetical protein